MGVAFAVRAYTQTSVDAWSAQLWSCPGAQRSDRGWCAAVWALREAEAGVFRVWARVHQPLPSLRADLFLPALSLRTCQSVATMRAGATRTQSATRTASQCGHSCDCTTIAECALCQEKRAVHTTWPLGPVCGVCYRRELAPPGESFAHSCERKANHWPQRPGRARLRAVATHVTTSASRAGAEETLREDLRPLPCLFEPPATYSRPQREWSRKPTLRVSPDALAVQVAWD